MNPMQTHVKVLGVLYIVFGVLFVLLGLGVFALFGGIASVVQLEGDPDAAVAVPIIGGIGGIFLILALGLSLPGIVGGIGILYYHSWARILMIVLSVLNLLNFPFGTALGVYGLWVLLTADGARLFEPGQVQSTV